MSSNKQIFSEINITPLTDIFLVLLIIMMVLAPTFQSVDKNITVPEINSGVNVEHKEVIVSVTKDNQIFVNETQVSSDNLASELKELLPSAPDKNIVVRADEKTKSIEIMKIISAAQTAGYEKLTVAGEPLNKKQQKELIDKAQPLQEQEGEE
jgi:biopolymer transport protein ExbD/biopolymer transport protein TolR